MNSCKLVTCACTGHFLKTMQLPTSTDQLQTITDGLNLPPFERRMTLINLSETLHDPVKAMQLLADVTYQVRPHPLAEDSKQVPPPVKVNAANLEQVATGITDFTVCLLDLNEPRSMADKQAFVQELVLPDSANMRLLLSTILKDLSASRETIYVSKFKLPPMIPADYMVDPQIQTLLSQLREAQSRFTEALNQNREVQRDQVIQRMERLATDKTTFLTRRDKLFDRVKQAKALSVPKEAVRLASRRRVALSEIEELKTQINSQNEIRRAALNAAKAVVNSARGTPANILEASETENKRLKQEIVNLTAEITEKESLAHLIQSEPGQEAIELMENELETLRTELVKYREMIAAVGSPDEEDNAQEKMTFLNQQLTKIKTQRAQLENRLTNARRESVEIDAEVAKRCSSTDIASLMRDIDDMDCIPMLLFKNLLSKGRALKPLHKKAMDEQQLLRKENAIVSRTKDILSVIPNLSTEVPDELADAGGLRPIGGGKQRVLGSIGSGALSSKNLLEAKAVLAELDATLQQKKRDLAPRISELAALKRQCAQLEADTESENQRAKTLEVSREGSVYKLRLGVRALELEIDNLKTQTAVADKKTDLLRFELEQADNVREFDRLKREITSENNACKTQMMEVRARQEELKCNLPNRMAQSKLFKSLVSILEFRKQAALERQEDHAAEMRMDKIRITN